jgi:hypothetical protein
MGQLAIPMMIGAAVGGGTKLLQGKGIGGILKGAALGGALGGATGGIGGLMSEGAVAGAEGVASQGAGGLLGATGSAGTGASLIPTIAESATPLASSAVAGTIEASPELVMGADGVLRNPAYFANMGGSPIYTGNGSMLDKLSMGAQSLGSDFSNPFTNGMGVDNLQGAAQIASMYQPQPMQTAPAGRIEVGQAPTGAIYDALRQTGYTLPKRRETNFSLLG